MDQGYSSFGTEKISKLLLKLAPPVMLAQLIQALYNIVDSYFIGKYSADGLSALSVLFPLQLLISALAIGTGVGVNTIMSRFYGLKNDKQATETAGVGFSLSIISWFIFAVISCGIMRVYTRNSLSSVDAQNYAYIYGMIVCAFSFGIFLESNWSKVLQAKGDMKTPMCAQILGAVTNIIFDYLLIFGIGIFPKMGVAGAAIATVLGQILAAIFVCPKGYAKIPSFKVLKTYIKPIYTAGIPNILINALCTIYIIAFNLLLVKFSDEAVTVLGLYYKLQTFFLIPVLGLTTCIVPILSFNYAANQPKRCKQIYWYSVIIATVLMAVGTVCFEVIPRQLLEIFAGNEEKILSIGTIALRIIGISFVPITTSLMFPIYFQAIGMPVQSITLTVLRQIVLLVPIAWTFSFIGLNYVWISFPITEVVVSIAGFILYIKNPIEKRYAIQNSTK
jgi:putative MATE family efflux protein